MRRLFLPILAMTAGLCPPTAAAEHQIGTVNVASGHYTNVNWSRFDGPVFRLRFLANNDAVDCEHITVTYRDGTVHTVFSGTLARGGSETITFPEGDSRIRNVEFACKAQSVDGARIALSSISEGTDFPGPGPDDGKVAPAHVRTEVNAGIR